MARKIEQLLDVIADLHRFTEGNAEASSGVTGGLELSESDLDLIAAAVQTPIDREESDNHLKFPL